MYLSFYQLGDEPFRLTPDPRYLHLAEPHQAALTVVLEGIFYRKGLVMITGPIGTGKTTLVHTALQVLYDKKMPVKSALIFNPTLTRDEFLELMLDEFDVKCTSTSKPKRLSALHRMLLETKRQGGTAVLFIDEAHLLSSELLEEIRLLGNADLHQEKLLQIVLSGQPELLSMMERRELSALQQRIAARAHLRPLTQVEMHVYISERLHAAGLKGQSPFLGQALEAIYRCTQGVPRLINLVCDACLTLGYRAQRHAIQSDMVKEVASALGLIKSPTVPENNILSPSEKPTDAPVGLTQASPTRDNGHFLPREEPVVVMQKTVVDTLIEAMKRSRALAQG